MFTRNTELLLTHLFLWSDVRHAYKLIDPSLFLNPLSHLTPCIKHFCQFTLNGQQNLAVKNVQIISLVAELALYHICLGSKQQIH